MILVVMNKNHVYAYLLLGAVVLAGVGGFMLSDYSPTSEISEPTSFHSVHTITILDPNQITEEMVENGQDS